MKTRRLGKTDLQVSLLGLGTMTFGRQNSEEEGHAQMDMALEMGVNFFDTAEMYAVPPLPETYGKTETILGNWFHKRQNRSKVILATKVTGPGLRWIRDGKALIDRKNILEALEGSLKRLQTDYIDLYQLHWPNRGSYHFGQFWSYSPDSSSTSEVLDNLEEVLQTLGELVKAGKIRHFGLSNETAWGTMKYLQLAESKNYPRPVSIQNEYSLLYRLHEPDLAEVSLREEVGLLAWSPLATGMLTGKYKGGKMPEGARWNLIRKFNQRNTKQAHGAVDRYLEIAKKFHLDPAQFALAFVASRPFVTSVLVGATSTAQLKINLQSLDIAWAPEIEKEVGLARQEFPIPY